jgi:hypothetical protein
MEKGHPLMIFFIEDVTLINNNVVVLTLVGYMMKNKH